MFNSKFRRPERLPHAYTVYEPAPLRRHRWGYPCATLIVLGGGAFLFLAYGAPVIVGLFYAIAGAINVGR